MALRHGSCLLPLLLHSPSQADGPVFGTSRKSDLLAQPCPCRPPGSLQRRAQSVMIGSLFAFRLRDRNALAAVCGSSRTAGWRLITLAHSSNGSVHGDRLRSPQDPKPRIRGRHSASQVVSRSAPLLWSRHGSIPLTAGLPGRLRREEGPSERKSVTSACGRFPSRMNRSSPQGPGTPVRPDHFPGFSPGLIPGHVQEPLPRLPPSPSFCQRTSSAMEQITKTRGGAGVNINSL